MSKEIKSSLYSRICAFLKVGDEGKVKSFLDRVIKNLCRSKEALTQNVKNLQFQLETITNKYNDQVEDLTQAIEDAQTGVDLSRIQRNADAEAYQQEYLNGIKRAKATLKAAHDRYESDKKAYVDRIEALEIEISDIDATISDLKG